MSQSAPGGNFRLETELCPGLPRLAWVAEIQRHSGLVHVLHGPWVEVRANCFFEGAWDGPFETAAFDQAITFAGTGGRVDGDAVLFAGPTHKLDRLQSVLTGDTLYVSNSLVLLLTRAGEDLDLLYSGYFFDYLRYFRVGLTLLEKPLRLRSGNTAYLHDCCNLRVTRDLGIERIEKVVPPVFTGFLDYAEFLERTAQRVSANAVDPARVRRFEPVAAISRGYDSVAVAAVASRANCRRAVTFRHSGTTNAEDSGAEIGAALGMEVTEYNRGDYIHIPGFPEAEFYISIRLAASTSLAVLSDALAGRLFFNGQGGEDYWDLSWRAASPLLAEPAAYMMAGVNFTEFRLRVGAIVFSLACSGAIHAPVMRQLGRSREMKPWSVGGHYDRPVPRRLAEERGVPRHLFGQVKMGGGPRFGPLDLCPASEADFREYHRGLQRLARSQGIRLLPRRRVPLDISMAMRMAIQQRYWLATPLRRIVGDRLDTRWGVSSLFTFHWGFYKTRERYVEGLKPAHVPT